MFDMMRLRQLIVYSMVAVGLSGCALFRSTKGPMDSVYDTLACQIRPDTLIVLLPGAYDKPQDFLDQGFVAAIREQKIAADVQLVDAHIGYYNQQQILQRLQSEVVEPARKKGYRRLWFVGISLGGYGTLLYSMKNPNEIDGFFVIAPYMGQRDLPALIERQGGLKTWLADNESHVDADLWRWLRQYGLNGSERPAAYLGYGAQDRFAQPNGVMVQVLPLDHRFVIAGGHDWVTWKQLWALFLAKAPFPRLSLAASPC
jgi:pimeloyl-ACP methyl ester carboxylesterase